MKNLCWVIGIVMLATAGAAGVLGCDGTDGNAEPEAECLDCGTLANGDTDITGDVRIDGFFEAVLRLKEMSDAAEANHEAQLDAMLTALGEDASGLSGIESKSATLVVELQAEIDANVSGSVRNWFAPPVCYSNNATAIEFQSQCEAFYGCEVDAECGGEEVSVGCEGLCLGTCYGGCGGNLICPVDAGAGGECAGTCDGFCSVPSSGPCGDICFGVCDATCSQTDADGCAGICEGNCTGECVDFGEMECTGSCDGDCLAMVSSEAECENGALCEGACSGECQGMCYGKVIPPPCGSESGSCEASAACEEVSSLLGYAYATCDVSWLELYYQLDASLEPIAADQFQATMAVVEVSVASIMDDTSALGLLMNSDATTEAGFDPFIMELTAYAQSIVDEGPDGFYMDPDKACCFVDAMAEAADILIDLSERYPALLQSQFALKTLFDLE